MDDWVIHDTTKIIRSNHIEDYDQFGVDHIQISQSLRCWLPFLYGICDGIGDYEEGPSKHKNYMDTLLSHFGLSNNKGHLFIIHGE